MPETPEQSTLQPERVRMARLVVHHLKKLVNVGVTFSGDVHMISGPPDSGKTTVVQAVEGALCGIDPRLVSQGATAGEVILHFTDGTVINRYQPSDGSKDTLSVSVGGHVLKDPKPFLEALVGKGSGLFHPLDWVTAGGGEPRGRTDRLRKQRDTLLFALDMSLDPGDVAAAVRKLGEPFVVLLRQIDRASVDEDAHPLLFLEGLEEAVYRHRAATNKEIEAADIQVSMHPAPQQAAPETDAETLAEAARDKRDAYHRAEGVAANQNALRKRRDDLKQRVEADAPKMPTVERVTQEIEQLQGELDAKKKSIANLERQLQEAREAAEAVRMEVDVRTETLRLIADHEARRESLEDITQDLERSGAGTDVERLAAQAQNLGDQLAARIAQDAHDEAAEVLATLTNKSEMCTTLIKLFRDTMPQALLAQTPMPYPGLSYADREVRLDGIPLDQIGTARQINVGVSVSAAIHKVPGFVFVDRAESLGKQGLGMFAQVVKERGLQALITFVDDDAVPGPGITVMDDGQVVKAIA